MVGERQGTVPAGLLLDLSAALCPRGNPVPAPASEIVGRCEHPHRRSELRTLVDRIQALPPSERDAMLEALDTIQVASKLWLVDELTRLTDLADCELLVLGAWFGVLPLLLNLRLEGAPRRMVCVDFDPGACRLGEQVIGSMVPNVEYRCADVMGYDYEAWSRSPVTVVVNTICEHLPDLEGWWARIPPGQLVVLQSNNYTGCPDHVNCARSLADMKEQTPLSEVLFEGVLPLSLFDRFMIIGRR
jgi:hypothetical protein